MPGRVSADRWAVADQLIADGKSNHDINRQTGISRPSIAKRRRDHAGTEPPPKQERAEKPRSDPPPRSRRPTKRGVSDEQLEAICRKIAKAPAIPAKLMLRCDYCALHFMSSGDELAAELVAYSHEDADLRQMLEWLASNWNRYRWAGLALGWAGVPLLHHAAPRVVYGAVAPLMGMPPRGPAETPHHQHHPPAPEPATNGFSAPANGNTPPPTADVAADAAVEQLAASLGIDLGALDVNQLIAMAQQFGLELPDGLNLEAMMGAGAVVDVEPTIGTDGDPEIPAVSDPATEAAPAETEAANPDPATE